MPKSPQTKRQEIIDHLVGNCDCGNDPQFTKEDVDVLNKFSIEQLEKLYAEDKEEDKEADKLAANKEAERIAEAIKKAKEDAELASNKEEPKQFDEASLPASVQEELQFARNMMQQKKDQLIAKITENKECLYTKEELGAKSVDDLTKMASLVGNKKEEEEVPKRQPKRLPGHATLPTDNETVLDDMLDLPIMNFEPIKN